MDGVAGLNGHWDWSIRAIWLGFESQQKGHVRAVTVQLTQCNGGIGSATATLFLRLTNTQRF